MNSGTIEAKVVCNVCTLIMYEVWTKSLVSAPVQTNRDGVSGRGMLMWAPFIGCAVGCRLSVEGVNRIYVDTRDPLMLPCLPFSAKENRTDLRAASLHGFAVCFKLGITALEIHWLLKRSADIVITARYTKMLSIWEFFFNGLSVIMSFRSRGQWWIVSCLEMHHLFCFVLSRYA